MALCPALILSIMYLTTINAQTFCGNVTNSGGTCFSWPSDCSNVDDCEMTMAAVDNNDTFTITLTGKSDGWIALGFSGDQLMGRDDVIMCIYDGSEVTLQHRYNVNNGKNNIQGTDLGDDLVLIEQSYTQGVISCTFDRTKSVDGATDAFGLVGRTYFGLFGIGPVAANGEPRIHNEFPWTSNSQIDLASGEIIQVSRRGGDPTPTARPSTSPGDTKVEATTSVGVTSPVSVTGTVILLLLCILFFE